MLGEGKFVTGGVFDLWGSLASIIILRAERQVRNPPATYEVTESKAPAHSQKGYKKCMCESIREIKYLLDFKYRFIYFLTLNITKLFFFSNNKQDILKYCRHNMFSNKRPSLSSFLFCTYFERTNTKDVQQEWLLLSGKNLLFFQMFYSVVFLFSIF